MKKILSIVLLFSCLLETTPWNTVQPCIASTITPSEQIVESDNSSISTENSLISYYDVYGEVYKQEPISVTSSSITLPIYTGRQEYYLANFVGWVYGEKPINVYPGDDLSNYTFLLPGTTCTISDNVDFAPLFLYRCVARPLLKIEKDTLDIGETTTCSTLGFSNEYVTYHCTDPSIARVESDGTITALRAGTTTIQANIYRKYDGYDAPVTFSLEETITVCNASTSSPATTVLQTPITTSTMLPTPTATVRPTPAPTTLTTVTPTIFPTPIKVVNNDTAATPLVATTLPPTKLPVSTPQAEIWEPKATNILAATTAPQVTYNQAEQQPRATTPTSGTNKTQNKSITYSKPKRIKNISWEKSVLHFSKIANVTGYQIKYSRTKNGKGKTITTKSCRKNMKPYHLKGIYYIKIRAYKKLKGTTIYGSWAITKKRF